MARLDQMAEPMRSHLAQLPCPTFDTQPWVTGPALARRRVSIISTAGLHRRGDRPFEGMTGDFRVIAGDIRANDLVMTLAGGGSFGLTVGSLAVSFAGTIGATLAFIAGDSPTAMIEGLDKTESAVAYFCGRYLPPRTVPI